jgi:hypothetical protein
MPNVSLAQRYIVASRAGEGACVRASAFGCSFLKNLIFKNSCATLLHALNFIYKEAFELLYKYGPAEPGLLKLVFRVARDAYTLSRALPYL